MKWFWVFHQADWVEDSYDSKNFKFLRFRFYEHTSLAE